MFVDSFAEDYFAVAEIVDSVVVFPWSMVSPLVKVRQRLVVVRWFPAAAVAAVAATAADIAVAAAAVAIAAFAVAEFAVAAVIVAAVIVVAVVVAVAVAVAVGSCKDSSLVASTLADPYALWLPALGSS